MRAGRIVIGTRMSFRLVSRVEGRLVVEHEAVQVREKKREHEHVGTGAPTLGTRSVPSVDAICGLSRRNYVTGKVSVATFMCVF